MLIISYKYQAQIIEEVYDPSRDDAIDTSDNDAVYMVGGIPDTQRVDNSLSTHEIQIGQTYEEELGDANIPSDIMDENEATTTPPHGRQTRFVRNEPRRQWEHGIIPYQFDQTLPVSYQEHYLNYVFPQFEFWTHFRFVPWNDSIPSVFQLQHQNYLRFVKKSYSCWSYIGNVYKMKGQSIACCLYSRCVHEISHAIGFYHEQANTLRDDYVRINVENIKPKALVNFKLLETKRTHAFGYYDAGSVMQYSSKAFTKNGFDTVTILDDELLHLENTYQTFYTFYEAQEIYKMKETKCPDFPLQCINDGYVSYINGNCRCRCTSGMDPKTGCATPIGADIWPVGVYSILKTGSDCPVGFHHVTVPDTPSSLTLSLDLCTKRYTQRTGYGSEWSSGSYCVVQTDSTPCPKGFEAEQFQSLDDKDSEEPSTHFGHTYVCCRQDGNSSDPLVLPLQKAFTLLWKTGCECQQVNGTDVKEIYPHILSSFGWKGCHYVPRTDSVKSKCGDMVNLGENNRRVIVTSPDYPRDYSDENNCIWFFKGPPRSQIKLQFTEFELHKGHTVSRKCNGHLEIRFVLPGQSGIKYCGSGFQKTIMSHHNSLQLILKGVANQADGTNNVQLSNRFNATISLLREEDLCYTGRGRDNSYHGNINVTRNFQTCLSWDKVTNCRHHVFREEYVDLDGNFCRNPGHGTQPWCYTDADTCDRAYCDVCQLRRCYDLFTDCQVLIQTDNNYCVNEPGASRGCRLSCGYCNAVEHPKPSISIIRCLPPPSHPPDGLIVTELKDYFSVGETIVYKCNSPGSYDNKQRKIVCTSEGSWSFLGKVCEGKTMCLDERQDCNQLLQRNPTMCSRYPDFATQKCVKTCGLCAISSRMIESADCDATEQPPHSVIMNGGKLKPGQVAAYSCEDGYVIQSGNQYRACQRNGQLTGHLPVCIAVHYSAKLSGGIPFDTCRSQYNPEGVQSWTTTRGYRKLTPGKSYPVKRISACRLFSVSAIIGPISLNQR